MAGDGKVKITTELDNAQTEKSMAKFSEFAKRGLGGIQTAAKVAAGAITAVSAGFATAGGAAIAAGKDFETSMAAASTLFGNVNVNAEKLNSSILEISNSTGIAASELNQSLYSALSAGIPVTEDMGEATAFLESSAKLAKAGFTDMDTALSATAKTLNAYGMDTSDADRINKILIQTQNKGITTVGELGASLSQVTPTAAAFGVSFENVGAALANMTAAGTPTAQATTQLNSLIAELGKSGTTGAKSLEKAAAGTEYAGMSFKEMSDAGVPLNKILDLIKKSADDSSLSMVDMFSSIEAGKAALALSGQNSAKFAENLEAMGTSADVVGEAYEKVSDTLETMTGKMAESTKNLGIEIYQGMQEPLKDAAKAGIDYVNQLTDAFKADGLRGLVEKAGDIFGELATKAAQKAPQMIDAAVDFIKSFAEGIYKNRHEIFNAAGDIAKSLADGLADLLPRSVRKPVKDAVKEISKSLSSGGLKKAVETVAKLFKGIGDAAGKVAKTVLPPFVKILDFAGEHVDTLAVAVAGCVAAYAGYSIVTGITTAVKASSAAFKASAIAMELLKLKTGEATIAQTAYNLVLNANPIGLVIAAVAALAAGYAALKLTTDDVVTAEEMEAQRFDEIAGKISDQKQSWEDLQEAKKVEIDSNMALVDKTKDLWGELQTIVDANGKIKEGYEDRAAFITGELSNSLDVEIEMTDGVIQKYGELSGSMDDLIEKKKAKILLDANEESYAEALKNTYEAEMNQAEAKRAVDEQALTVAQKQKEYNDALAKSQEAVAIGSMAVKGAREREVDAAADALQKEKKDLAEKEQVYDDATDTVLDYYKTVSDYTELSAAIESNNSAEMQKAIESVTTSRKEATASNASELARQLENQRTHIDILRQEYVAGEKGVTEDRVASAEAREAQLKLQYDKEVGNVDAYTADIAGFMDRMTTDLTDDEAEQLGVWLGMVADAELHGREISDETKKMVDTVIANVDDMPPQTREIMKNAMIPMLEEMKNAEPGLYAEAASIPKTILSLWRQGFAEHSPSKATRKIFRYVMEGAELGLEDERNNLNRQTDEISSGLLDRLKNIDVSGWMNRIYGAMDSYQEVLSPSVQLAHATGRTASKTAAGNASQAIDYGRIGKEMQKALNGVQVAIDGRRAGEILSPIVDKQLGEAEKWKGRG